MRITRGEFEGLVADALDTIPPDLLAAMDNVVVLVEWRNAADPELLGLYEGVALTERTSDYGGVLPDRITIYQDAIVDICAGRDEVVPCSTQTADHPPGDDSADQTGGREQAGHRVDAQGEHRRQRRETTASRP